MMVDVAEKPIGNSVSFLVRDMPRGLRNRFKALCAKKEVSMNDGMVQLVEQAIEKDSLDLGGSEKNGSH